MEVANTLFKTLSRRLPRDAINTFLRRFKTSSRRVLVKAKDLLETVYIDFVSTYAKLDTYYDFINGQTDCINLNKLNLLKHGNNAKFLKTWFSIKYQRRKYFF